MECQICVVLEAIRYDRIDKYVRLVEEFKRARSPAVTKEELAKTLASIEAELNEAWKRLAARRESHPEVAAPYNGSRSDLHRAICNHCAEALEPEQSRRQIHS